jgi:tetratricopeptide (TPR) repeat protein
MRFSVSRKQFGPRVADELARGFLKPNTASELAGYTKSRVSRLPSIIPLIALGALVLGTAPGTARADEDPDAVAARNEFAEHMAELGQNWSVGARSQQAFLETAALLRAAERSNPGEPRYPRLLAYTMAAAQDTDGEIAAWNEYRRLYPEDRVVAARVIELYASKLQTADAKLAYLKGLIANAAVPVEIRAHLAALCVAVLLERSNSDAIAMVAEGLKLYPLPELLKYQFMLVSKNAGPVERVRGLIALLKSNPMQLQVIDALAQELANDGLPEESAEWMNLEAQIGGRMGIRQEPQFFVNLAAEMYLAGQSQAAQRMLANLLNVDPDSTDFMFLALTLQRSAHDQAGYADSIPAARNLLLRRWAIFNATIFSKDGTVPASQPAAQPVADPIPAIARLRELNKPTWNEYFAVTLEDLAWFELYYAGNPKSAQTWIDALRQALPANDPINGPILARLQGWYDLGTGNDGQARQELAPLADRDPLAALGVIRLDAADKSGARDKLRKLLHEHPMGMAAATLNEALLAEEAPAPATNPTTNPTAALPAPSAAQPAAETPLATSIRAELKKFPTAWLGLLGQPSQFYTVSAEPMKTTVRFGEPLMGRITLTNRTDQDLVIGFGGPIQPDLWIGAKVTGIAAQEFPTVAYDQLTGAIVLRGHGSVSQVTRIDQGELGELIRQRANGTMLVAATVTTNPVRVGAGAISGPGGEDALFGRPFVRLPNELQSASSQRQLSDDFSTGSPLDRMQDLDLLGAFVLGLDKETDPSVRALADSYLHYIDRARRDATPEVAAWASYLSATLPGMPAHADTIAEMLRSPAWQTRLLAIAAARNQPVDAQQRVCGPVAQSDPDPLPKALATAMLQALKQPTTAPTTQP